MEGLSADGVLGLGYHTKVLAGLDSSDFKRATAFNRDYLDELKNNHVVDKVMFGINIEADAVSASRPSTFTLNGYDSSVVTKIDDVNFHPVSSEDYWALPFEGVMAGGERLPKMTNCSFR